MSKSKGQILYLSTAKPEVSTGSLSSRFQKLAQGRQKSGVVIVNQSNSQGIESRPGRSLGLGFNTGSSTANQQGGNRISTRSGDGGGGPIGIQTPRAAARAMQEYGSGVTDSFLLNPSAAVMGGGRGHGGVPRGSARAGIQTASGAGGPQRPRQNINSMEGVVRTGGPIGSGRKARRAAASPYAAAAVSSRGRANTVNNGNSSQNQAAARAGRNPAALGQGNRQPQQSGKKGKNVPAAGAPSKKGAKKTKPDQKSLDSELADYMMKNESTAASLLDNDLDSYMADVLTEEF